jgi:ATP-dependent DNA ligase
MITAATRLLFQSGSSDKEYLVQIVQDEPGRFSVVGYNGRRGGNLTQQIKGRDLFEIDADELAASIVNAKTRKGYVVDSTVRNNVGAIAAGVVERKPAAPALAAALLTPVDASMLEAWIADPQIALQEKYDGERVVVDVRDSAITAANRNGMTRPLPTSIVADLEGRKLFATLDCEIIGDVLYVFDVLPEPEAPNESFDERCGRRFAIFAADRHVAGHVRNAPTYVAATTKRELIERVRRENGEGIVARELEGAYLPGRPRTPNAWKIKFYATLSALVLAKNEQRSVLLGLLDGNQVPQPVGNVTVPSNAAMPSIFESTSPLDQPAPGCIVEVRYLPSRGTNLYQPVLLGTRTDITPAECTLDQIVAGKPR